MENKPYTGGCINCSNEARRETERKDWEKKLGNNRYVKITQDLIDTIPMLKQHDATEELGQDIASILQAERERLVGVLNEKSWTVDGHQVVCVSDINKAMNDRE